VIALSPSPTNAARRSPLSRKGRGLSKNTIAIPQQSTSKGRGLSQKQPSPLAGEGARQGGEGANRTLKLAKKLRHAMTDAETKLWQQLRANRLEKHKLKRQQPIGKYIADFVNLEHRFIIEVDGSQHEGSQHDQIRDAWLRSHGFRILRFWNIDVLTNMEGVIDAIFAALKETP